MNKFWKQTMALFLAFALVFGTLAPAVAWAEEPANGDAPTVEVSEAEAPVEEEMQAEPEEPLPEEETEGKETEAPEALELSEEKTPDAQGAPASTEKTFTVTKRPYNEPEAQEELVDEYDTLWDVMANCTDRTLEDLYIVTMNKDYEITTADTTWGKNGVNIVLRSAGSQAHTLSSGLERVMVTFDRGSTFETQNVIFDGKGKARFTIADNSKITLGKGTVVQNFVDLKKQGAPAIYLTGNSKLNILEGVTIQNNTSVYYGGAICAWDSEVNISGGTFQGNSARNGGVIGSFRGSNLNITGGMFEKNTATRSGGVIYTAVESTIQGATFTNNSAKWGGAIYSDGTTTAKNSTFTSNKASAQGGAIYQSAGNLDIDDTTFAENSAISGGSLYNKGNVNLTSSNFTENKGMYYGGAIYQQGGKLHAINTVFTKNTMTGDPNVGGAIYFNENLQDKQRLETCTFAENSAVWGAGIYLDVNTKLYVGKSTFTENKGVFGAAIATPAKKPVDATKAQLTVSEDSSFEGNRAYQGGALFTAVPTVIKKTTFAGNEARLAKGDDKKNPHNSGVGGAIYVMNQRTEISETKFEENKAYGSGGAITISGVTRDDDGNITSIKPDIKVTIGSKTSFTSNEAGVGQGGAIYTIPYQYRNPILLNDSTLPIEEQNPYANLTVAKDTAFAGNKASQSFLPPTNYAQFTNLGFSKNSFTDRKNVHERFKESLLNNDDVNYKNPAKLITYLANGGKFDDDTTVKSEEHAVDEIITIRKAPTRRGYTFKYWKGSEYQPGDPYTVEDHHTFVAQWEKDERTPQPPMTEQIIVDPNGGTFSDGTTGRKTYDLKIGETFLLPAAPTREGYKFIAWQGKSGTYQPGDVYTVKRGGDVFTARWEEEKKPEEKPSVTPNIKMPKGTPLTRDEIAKILQGMKKTVPAIPKAGVGK